MSCATQHGERTEIEREELAVVSDYRFVTEQTVIYEDGVEYNDMNPPLRMETTLIIYKGNQEIHREEEWRWEIGRHHPKSGTDVTGDGSPDVVLTEYSGGAHCCFTYYIFELREPLNRIKLYTGDGLASFEELDELPGLELVVSDDNFTYWTKGFAGSPFPDIGLRYKDGDYKPDVDLFWRPALSDAQLNKLVAEVPKDEWELDTDYLPDEFLSGVTDLIYAGHVDQALQFIELAWPSDKPGQDEFIAELFQCRLRRSQYWPAIAQLNGLQPDEPRKDCQDNRLGRDKTREWIVRSEQSADQRQNP